MEWKPVPGWEHKYEVSDNGRVKNILSRKLIVAHYSPKGYPRVNLLDYKNGNRVVPVHALVASAFIGPRPKGKVVHHINGIRDDNRVSNLCYMLKRDHDREHQIGETNSVAKLTWADVLNIKDLAATGMMYKEIATLFNVNRSLISMIMSGKRWGG